MTKEEEILAAATRRLNEVPTLSMAELAQAIGISRATLHRHFATREALLHKLALRAVGEWERIYEDIGMDAAIASDDPRVLADTIRALLRGVLVTVEEYGFALSDHFVVGLPDVIEWTERLEERTTAFIVAAQRAGVLNSDMPPRWIDEILYGLMIGVRDALRSGKIARRDAEDLLYTTFLRGVGSERNEA